MELDRILKEDSFSSNPKRAELLKGLFDLQHSLRELTLRDFKRVNPLQEDLTDWKERGEFLFGKGKNITVYNSATVAGDVKVGENTWIGPYVELDGSGGLEIGDFCSISLGVNITTHDTVKWALSGGKMSYERAPVKIGNYCFIGTQAFIAKGITIGDHVLVGAGAVVTKDLPDFSIAAGVPAKIIGKVILENNTVTLEYF
ncbi:MAG: acyltransferase [Bacteroidia bacterium]|nr:acyltransferase [Bacteroidia bacterium]